MIDGSEYIGKFKEGLFEGWGVHIDAKGVKYEGYFEEGKRNGFGKLFIQGKLINKG